MKVWRLLERSGGQLLKETQELGLWELTGNRQNIRREAGAASPSLFLLEGSSSCALYPCRMLRNIARQLDVMLVKIYEDHEDYSNDEEPEQLQLSIVRIDPSCEPESEWTTDKIND